MLEIEDEIIGSQSEESEQHEDDTNMDDVMSMFGIEKEESENDDPPAKEEVVEEKNLQRIERVKHNKGEAEVDISTTEKLHDHLQRSLALDKERERKSELEKNLDRAAKLAGYKDHNDFVANLDAIEQRQKQNQQDAHNQLLADLREEAEEVGLDPDKLESYLKNHPLVKEGERALQEREQLEIERATQSTQESAKSKWSDLYTTYPELVESSKAFNDGGIPDWFTPDMQSRLDRGYDPKDAYELAHRGKLQMQSKKVTEQRVIKEQHLGLRSKVETTTDSDNAPQVPSALANAFAAFGLPANAAQKYIKK